MRRVSLLALLALPLAAPGLAEEQPVELPADAPPEIVSETEQALTFCREAGGTPSLNAAYLDSGDLNGDGTPDHVIDLAGLDCLGAPSLFCGPDGCPVMVWLSGPTGHAQGWGGFANAARIEDGEVVIDLHGDACDPPGADACEERLDFAGVFPTAEPGIPAPDAEAEAAIDAATDPDPAPQAEAESEAGPGDDPGTEPAAEPGAPPPGAVPPAAAMPGEPVAPGWTLRAVPDGEPVALAGGTGAVASLAAFCLGGEPWLAVTFADPPEAESVRLDFSFPRAGAEVSVPATREEGAGGAHVAGLAADGLARLLAGRDGEAGLAVAGADQGMLSLSGSTRAIRDALAGCQTF